MSELSHAPPSKAASDLDLLLIALTFSSGMIDAISYMSLGGVFSAFMTGNLVFLGLGIAHTGGPNIGPVIIALAAFAAGGYFGNWITGGKLEENLTWPPKVSYALAGTTIALVVFFLVWLTSGGRPGGMTSILLLALSGLAMGMQTAAARALHVPAVFTTAATFTVLVATRDLAVQPRNPELRRLVLVLLSLVCGAGVGGLLLVLQPVVAPIIPIALTATVAMWGYGLHKLESNDIGPDAPSDRSEPEPDWQRPFAAVPDRMEPPMRAARVSHRKPRPHPGKAQT
jgi:uncharacterized membrane protein YoaK (UPF0700 family)